MRTSIFLLSSKSAMVSSASDTRLLGSWSSYSRRRKSLDALIQDAVSGVLRDADIALDMVDCVITVSSDTVDGALAPLLRSEAAGAPGHDYLHVTGASASAIHAAMTLIKSNLAGIVLVVGWGEWTKKVVDEVPELETDPVFHRALGIGSLQLAAMQTNWLIEHGLVSREGAIAYANAMRARRYESDELHKARTRRLLAPREATPTGICRELMPDGIDRATALLLCAAESKGKGPSPGLRIESIATCFRPLWPRQEDLDPAVWVSALLEQGRLREEDLAGLAIELSSTNAVIGLRGLSALGAAGDWSRNSLLNRYGGSLAAYNGAADGLARMDLLARSGRGRVNGQPPRGGLVIELAGPLGQAAASVHLAYAT